jgi:hypothetical protein
MNCSLGSFSKVYSSKWEVSTSDSKLYPIYFSAVQPPTQTSAWPSGHAQNDPQPSPKLKVVHPPLSFIDTILDIFASPSPSRRISCLGGHPAGNARL